MSDVRRAGRPRFRIGARLSPDPILTDPKGHEQTILRSVCTFLPLLRYAPGFAPAQSLLKSSPPRSRFAYNELGAPTRLPFREEVLRKPRPFPPALRSLGSEFLRPAPATTHVPLARAHFQHGRTIDENSLPLDDGRGMLDRASLLGSCPGGKRPASAQGRRPPRRPLRYPPAPGACHPLSSPLD